MSEAIGSGTGDDSKQAKILVVDDQPNNHRVYQRILESFDLDFVTAMSGQQALGVAHKHDFFLILMDVQMPGMDGFETASLILEHPKTKHIPVIFITAFAREQRFEFKGYASGAVDYLIKPINDVILKSKVGVFLALHQQRKKLQISLQQHRQTELKLQAERDYTGILTEQIPAIICGITPDGITRFINPAGELATGYATAELLGKNWWHTFYPGAEYQQVERLFKIMQHNQVQDYEMTLTRKDGEQRIIAWNSLNQYDQEGKLLEIVGFGHDVTRRKHSEQALQQLQNYLKNIIDSMPAMLIGVDVKGEITQWNKTAEQATGIITAKAQGNNLVAVFPAMAAEMANISRSLNTRQKIQQHKMPFKLQDRDCYLDMTIYPLLTNGVAGAVILIDDVTDKVRMEEMMVQSEKMSSVGGLAAGMAHEINNPLAGMMQTANVLLSRLTEKLMPANMRAADSAGIDMDALYRYMETRGMLRMITAINDSGRRIEQIVENMLSFARKSDAVFSCHHLAELMDKTLALAAIDYDLKKQYDFKTINIVKDYADNLPGVPCESGPVQQVLLNILRNGAEAMQSASTVAAQFTLQTWLDQSKNIACIGIKDNGPGMDENTRKRIFEPFYTTKAVGVGSGLGLSVSYFIIVENHGGELSVESTVGEGSRFIIGLPLAGKHD